MKHQVTLDFQTEAVSGKIKQPRSKDSSTIVEIHLKMSKRFYKPIWKHVLLKDPDFVRYLVGQLHSYIENNWAEIVRATQCTVSSRVTFIPWAIFIQPGKNFFVDCNFTGVIPVGEPPPDLNTFLNIPIIEV